MYLSDVDFAHPLQDRSGITHSLCSLEYEDHRPLYDWVTEHADLPSPPRQIEFARLNMTYTVMSKRKLRLLVEEGLVDGWDDPRMPTLSGMRRRGYTPAAIRSFLDRIGVSKVPSVVDYAFLEHCLREDLTAAPPHDGGARGQARDRELPAGQRDLCKRRNTRQTRPRPARSLFPGNLDQDEDFMRFPGKEVLRLFPAMSAAKHAYVIAAPAVPAARTAL